LQDISARKAAAVTAVRSLLIATALFVVYFNVPVRETPSVSSGTLLALGLLGFIALLAVQVRSIMRSNQPRLRAVEVLATVAPLFILLFAMSYYVLALKTHDAFSQPLSRLDALYFAVTVFATVGFGDVVARSEVARTIVIIQMIGDLVVLGLGLRVLLGAVKIGLTRQQTGGDGKPLASPVDRQPTAPRVNPATSAPRRRRTRAP
jgi:voltage-gated potassium channel